MAQWFHAGRAPQDRRAGPQELFTLACSQQLGGGSKPCVRPQKDRQRGPSAQCSISLQKEGNPDPGYTVDGL